MTPSADPTSLHVILESAGGGGLSDALIGSLLGAGVTGTLGLLVMWLNNWYQNKRHQADLAERQADRLFKEKYLAGTELLEALRELLRISLLIDTSVADLVNAQYKIKTQTTRVNFLYKNAMASRLDEIHENLIYARKKYTTAELLLKIAESDSKLAKAHPDDRRVDVRYAELKERNETFDSYLEKCHKEHNTSIEELKGLKDSLDAEIQELTQQLQRELKETPTSK